MALPFADTAAMQLHLDEISRHVARGAHAVLLLDRAGWHTSAKLKVPKNITPVLLPSRAPELNPVENVWHICAPTGSPIASSMATTRHHRRRLRGLAEAHRPTRNNRINRNARVGSRRSSFMTLGIRRWMAPARGCQWTQRAANPSDARYL